MSYVGQELVKDGQKYASCIFYVCFKYAAEVAQAHF